MPLLYQWIYFAQAVISVAHRDHNVVIIFKIILLHLLFVISFIF